MIDARRLAELFAQIDATYFHPHPFTPEEAARIAAYQGQDLYLAQPAIGPYFAYGMLRGWDEGYEIPSLGVAVRPDKYGQRWGKDMMERLHEAARRRGATRVRLRVHPDNERARRLYDRMRYIEVGEERGETLMIVEL